MATVGQTSLVLNGVGAFQAKLDRLGKRMPEVLGKALVEVAHMAKAHMQERYLTNGPLYVGGRNPKARSQGSTAGQLRRNWQVHQLRGGDGAVGAMVSTNTPYARVHNYGFHGPVQVREHIRKPPRGGGRREGRVGGIRGGAGGAYRPWRKAHEKRLRFRAENSRRSADKRRRQRDSYAAHGMSVRRKQAESRAYRRATGLQGGIQPLTGRLNEKAKAKGAIVVRAHGRYMKLRGHLYVERTLRDVRVRAQRLLEQRIDQAVARL